MDVSCIKLTSLLILTCTFVSLQAYTQTVSGDSTYITTDTVVKPPAVTAAAQHLYRVNPWISSTFCVLATAADIYAIPNIIKNKRDITAQEIQGLNTQVFTGFDRFALDQDPSKRKDYAQASDYMLPALIVLPAFLVIDKNIKKDWFRILVMYYETHAITFSIYNYSPFGPLFQDKYRPLVYYNQLTPGERRVGNNRNSMYSGHTATAIASTYFMVKVYCDYHPEIGNKKYILYGIATIPPLVEGYLRVKAMLHFPSDAMIGIVIGAACGILVPEIHRFKNHKVNLGISSTQFGPALNMTWNID